MIIAISYFGRVVGFIVFHPTSLETRRWSQLNCSRIISSSCSSYYRLRINPSTRLLSAYRFPLGSSEYAQFNHFVLIELTNGINSWSDGMQTNTSRCDSFQVNSGTTINNAITTQHSNRSSLIWMVRQFGCLSHVIHSYDNEMAVNKTKTKLWSITTWKRRECKKNCFFAGHK